MMFARRRGEAGAGGAGAAAARGQIPTVTVVVPGRSQVARTVTASGALAARRDQPVGIAGEGGMVTRVLVDAGAWVRQGQVLATVDRSVQSQEAAQLAAQIQVARADAALAQNELDRAQALVARGFVSKADLDRKRAARDAAAARVRVAQAQFGATRARVGRLDIRAPTSGLVLARNVEVGQVVGAGRRRAVPPRRRRRDGDARPGAAAGYRLRPRRNAGQRHPDRARPELLRARCGRYRR